MYLRRFNTSMRNKYRLIFSFFYSYIFYEEKICLRRSFVTNFNKLIIYIFFFITACDDERDDSPHVNNETLVDFAFAQLAGYANYFLLSDTLLPATSGEGRGKNRIVTRGKCFFDSFLGADSTLDGRTKHKRFSSFFEGFIITNNTERYLITLTLIITSTKWLMSQIDK